MLDSKLSKRGKRMKNITIFFCLILTFFVSMSTNANEPSKDSQIEDLPLEDIRIFKLLPGLLSPLAIDPAIPENFIALSQSKYPDLYEGVFWGPKEVLEKLFEDPSSLCEPIIKVKFSNSSQSEIEGELKDFTSKMEGPGLKVIKSLKTHWGPYPVLVASMDASSKAYPEMGARRLTMAWVGLNDSSGHVLSFQLIPPGFEQGAVLDDSPLWNNFIYSTKGLQGNSFLKANGQDLQPGCTIFNVWGEKLLKAVAEKRGSEGSIQIVITPLNDNVEFKYSNLRIEDVELKGNVAASLAKIYGMLEQKGNGTLFMETVIYVLIKNVEEFSINGDEIKLKQGVSVIHQ